MPTLIYELETLALRRKDAMILDTVLNTVRWVILGVIDKRNSTTEGLKK